jgi:hypothetical protein
MNLYDIDITKLEPNATYVVTIKDTDQETLNYIAEQLCDNCKDLNCKFIITSDIVTFNKSDVEEP